MKRTVITLSLIFSVVAPECSLGQIPYPPVADEVACKIRHDIKEANSLSDLPPQLQSYLQGPWDRSEPTQTGFADRGAYFNESGIPSRPGPVHRFIRGGVYQHYWYVFYEHGEPVTSHQVVVFAPDIDHLAIIVRAQPENISRPPSSLCVVLDSIIDRSLH